MTIRFPDLADGRGFTAVPNSVLDDHQLGPETRFVYVMLRRLAPIGRAGPLDQRELAHHIGVSAHRIPRHLTLLQRRGLIRIDGRSSTQTPVRYLLDEPAVHRSDRSARRPASPRAQAANGRDRLSLVDRLISMGVDPHVAAQLVTKYPRERVAGALRAVHRRRPRPRDPAAWVVAAIRQGWVAQSATVATRAWQAAQEAAIAAWERRTDAALATLSTQTQDSLRRQATELLQRRFGPRLAASRIGPMLVTVELRRLVAEQIGLPIPGAVPAVDSPARPNSSAG